MKAGHVVVEWRTVRNWRFCPSSDRKWTKYCDRPKKGARFFVFQKNQERDYGRKIMKDRIKP
jgi:hypothetical protein